jgi:hypothetical protein
VAADGTRTEPASGALEGRGPVTGLALDRDGSLFVVFGSSREILRIDLAGSVIEHAWFPEPTEIGAGLLGMAFDPVNRDLLVSDGACIRRITATGMVTAPLTDAGPVPAHLAVHGRLLLMLDAERGELQALHLENGHRKTPCADPAEPCRPGR